MSNNFKTNAKQNKTKKNLNKKGEEIISQNQ